MTCFFPLAGNKTNWNWPPKLAPNRVQQSNLKVKGHRTGQNQRHHVALCLFTDLLVLLGLMGMRSLGSHCQPGFPLRSHRLSPPRSSVYLLRTRLKERAEYFGICFSTYVLNYIFRIGWNILTICPEHSKRYLLILFPGFELNILLNWVHWFLLFSCIYSNYLSPTFNPETVKPWYRKRCAKPADSQAGIRPGLLLFYMMSLLHSLLFF